jgi:uncharacterized protein
VVAYLDSSAAVKLAHREQHSAELVEWLNAQAGLILVSSALVEVELSRALWRYDPEALPHVPAVLERLVRVEINATVRAIAAAYQQPTLRSLDAVHLATARYLASRSEGELDVFVAYDARLLAAVAADGVPVASPGIQAAE